MPSRVTLLPPSPALADEVMGYVVRRRSDDAAAGPASPAAFPANLYATLTIVHSGSLRDPANGHATTGACFAGAMTREASREYIDEPETTVVLFKPGRLTDVCRLPAGELTDRWVDAGAVLSPRERLEISDRMPEQATVARQVHVLEMLLERRLQRASASRALPLARMVQRLFWQLPFMQVSALAEHAGLGGRQLHRRCLDTFGVPPRLLIRLARLQLSLWQVQAGARRGGPLLPSVARRSGFADHAHMAREFRALLGRSPGALRRRMALVQPSEWAYELPQDLLDPQPVA
ncbi:helix-turn-helix domain-containing protein [Variovorax sp. JS1663]|uniref:helix-turn-helix domain-containing protein n=1 Tax=Variovorax sp. JS1663 TaxID=1851577 RepID=UPI000B345139|nr:helix-turn-helix domain-containing protein [Variovorax sp. JS1663]OUM02457.1 hypothetical protein A8M77_10820 [Variovorax sp. JS1663]OUM02458.1 hypothetical protein A8M77_10825 [Variovorax sp. JS1663]